jgi:hypothetical protein
MLVRLCHLRQTMFFAHMHIQAKEVFDSLSGAGAWFASRKVYLILRPRYVYTHTHTHSHSHTHTHGQCSCSLANPHISSIARALIQAPPDTRMCSLTRMWFLLYAAFKQAHALAQSIRACPKPSTLTPSR